MDVKRKETAADRGTGERKTEGAPATGQAPRTAGPAPQDARAAAMKIKIDRTNAAKIEDQLAKVNGRAKAFAITTFGQVENAAALAEARLAALPLTQRAGASATYIPAGPGSNSYRYGADSTELHLVRNTVGWILTAIHPARVYPRSGVRMAVTITPEQRDGIAQRAVAGFHIAA